VLCRCRPVLQRTYIYVHNTCKHDAIPILYTMGNNIFFPAFLYYFFLFFFSYLFFFPSTVCPQRIRRWCAFSVFFFSSAVTLLLLRRPRTATPESRPAHRYISLFLLVVNPSLIEFDVRKSSWDRLHYIIILYCTYAGTVIFIDKAVPIRNSSSSIISSSLLLLLLLLREA